MNQVTVGKLLAAASLSLAMTGSWADTLVFEDSFGTIGDPFDVPTNISAQPLSVAGWASVMPTNATLTNVRIEVYGSVSTQGEATNNAANAANLSLITFVSSGDWRAYTNDLANADHVFASQFTTILNEDLGTVNSGETITFGPFTRNDGWATVFDGLDASIAALSQIDYFFDLVVTSAVQGSSNMSSSLRTGTAGGLRVTYTYTTPSGGPVPTPGPLALLGTGLLGLMLKRKQWMRAGS